MKAWEADERIFRMWKTHQSRYSAFGRLHRKQRVTLYSVSLASAGIITLSVIPYAFQEYVSANQASVLTLFGIFLSIIIIVISLIEGSADYSRRADTLYANARLISQIANEASAAHYANEKERIDSLQLKYEESVSSCPFNHENLDFLYVQLQNPASFPEVRPAEWRFFATYWLLYSINVYGFFVILLLLVVFFPAIVIFCI